MLYYADNSNTHIVVPILFRPFFGSLLHLAAVASTPSLNFKSCQQWMRVIGPLYYFFMSLQTVHYAAMYDFSGNSHKTWKAHKHGWERGEWGRGREREQRGEWESMLCSNVL
jgi:hypothetical protein